MANVFYVATDALKHTSWMIRHTSTIPAYSATNPAHSQHQRSKSIYAEMLQ